MPPKPPKSPAQIQSSLVSKAANCGPDRIVPTAVLPLMVAAKLGSSDSFVKLQGTIDYLTCLAKAGSPFSIDQKEFMHDLFEAFAVGGRISGMPEAADLADHYVNGRGAFKSINPEVYQTSVIVKDAMIAMTAFIIRTIGSANSLDLISSDVAFVNSNEAKPLLERSGRSSDSQGVLVLQKGNKAALRAEQNNLRLKNTDHRFALNATATKQGSNFLAINWWVFSTYDFDKFKENDFYTNIPLGVGRTLRLPDGLSEYLTKTYIGVAQVFDHEAKWQTTVHLKDRR
jgi:hypothetical protein